MWSRAGIALIVGSGCLPHARLVAIDASDVALPPHVRELALVADATVDEVLADQVLKGVEAVIQGSSMRAAIRTDADPCAGDIDAVIRLESVTPHTDRNTDRHHAGVNVQRQDQMTTAWLLRDCAGEIRDDFEGITLASWSGAGETTDEAADALPSDEEASAELAFSAGASYGRRIATVIDQSVLSYFAAGDRRLRSAAFALRIGDWDGASVLWREVAADPAVSANVRARALYDLGVYYEIHGNYPLALSHTEHAVAVHPSARLQRQRDRLRQRMASARTLRFPIPEGADGS